MTRRPPSVRALRAVAVVLATGCPRGQAQPPEPPRICSDDARFATYDWIPDDARLTTSIARRDPGRDAALARLVELTDAREVVLPVLASMNYRNLGLQLSALARLLDELGADPGELVELHGPRGEVAWIWANDCPLELVAARLAARWQLILRADLERPGLRLASGSPEGLPFDLIVIGERRVALTLLGRGEAVAAWLHDSPHGADAGPGHALEQLAPAPIRSILGGDALLTTSASERDAPAHHLRVTDLGWEID